MVATSENPAPQHQMLYPVAVRMADEGVPVLAIARATNIPSSELYTALREAISQGFIVEMPQDDWPHGSTRSARCIVVGTKLQDPNELKVACTRYFKASPLEAAMLSLLLRRDEVSKPALHTVIENNRDPNKETTEIKMVDVMICKLRKKLRAGAAHPGSPEIQIQTLWGTGYFISSEDRTTALNAMLAMGAK